MKAVCPIALKGTTLKDSFSFKAARYEAGLIKRLPTDNF